MLLLTYDRFKSSLSCYLNKFGGIFVGNRAHYDFPYNGLSGTFSVKKIPLNKFIESTEGEIILLHEYIVAVVDLFVDTLQGDTVHYDGD